MAKDTKKKVEEKAKKEEEKNAKVAAKEAKEAAKKAKEEEKKAKLEAKAKAAEEAAARKAEKEAKKAEKENVPEFLELPGEPCDLVSEALGEGKEVAVVFLTAFDPDSDACKECEKDFPETQEACKFNTELAKSVKGKKKTAKKGAGGPRGRGGERTVLGGLKESGTGRMELLMLREEGASSEELAAQRGCWQNHINTLKKKGVNIERKDGRYYAKVA